MIDPDGLYINVKDFEGTILGNVDYYIPKQSDSNKTWDDAWRGWQNLLACGGVLGSNEGGGEYGMRI